MSSIISGPVALFQDALRTVDKQLENVSLAADALQRGRAPLPPITSDFNEAERQSFISKTIGAIRDQVQRGLPIASLPPDTLVCAPIFYQTVSADDDSSPSYSVPCSMPLRRPRNGRKVSMTASSSYVPSFSFPIDDVIQSHHSIHSTTA